MAKLRILGSTTSQPTEKEIAQVDPFVNAETVTINKELDGQKSLLFRGTLTPQGTTPPPPINQPPVIHTPGLMTGKPNEEVTLSAHITDDGNILEDVNWLQTGGPVQVVDTESEEAGGIYKTKFTPPEAGTYTYLVEAYDTQNARSAQQVSIQVDPIIIPPPPTGNVLYDSLINSKLHDKRVRTIKQEGCIGPNGLGVECRASGNPRIRVNEDGTFSLICDSGHGRFYLYVLNYNVTYKIICAFWNKKDGQDISLKDRSRHNEAGRTCDGGSPIEPNRFGGYGFAIDWTEWGGKREPTHNCHDQSKSGSLSGITAQKYMTLEFTVKDEGSNVRQIGKVDGVTKMDKLDTSPKPFMRDQALYAKQSYLWFRQNLKRSGGEIRIKQIQVLKA
jgi:hypothetical protein